MIAATIYLEVVPLRRGLALNLVGNILFFVCGYVVQYFLGNTMSAANYGVVGTIVTILDFEYMFLSNGARQSLAKEIAMHRYSTRDVIIKSVAFQIIIIALFFSINYFGAPLFGSLFNDPSLNQYIRIAAFLVPANGFFVLLLGISDGIQAFTTTAMLNILYPIFRLSVIPLILFIFQDDPILGVEAGYFLALAIAIVVGLIALFSHRERLTNDVGDRIGFGTVAHGTLSFSLFFIMVSIVLSVDTLVVKSTVQPAAMTGYYTGAVNFGKVSYSLMTAFFTMILPVVSKAVGKRDFAGAHTLISKFILIVFAFVLPIPIMVSASSEALLSAFYRPEYAIAATPLSFLSMSSFFMGMTVLMNMVYIVYKTSRFSDVLSVSSMAIVIPLFIAAARMGGIDAIAAASVVCTFITMLVSYFMLSQVVGTLVTRQAIFAIAINVGLWIVVRTLFYYLNISNLILLGLVYMMIYLVYVAIVITLKIVPNLSDLVRRERR